MIRAKVGLLELGKQLGNVSQACKIMGDSRGSFYRFQELYDKGGEVALAKTTKCRAGDEERRWPAIERAIAELAVEPPALGPVRIANDLRQCGRPSPRPACAASASATLPANISWRALVNITKRRWRIERDYQDLKHELGLGHYEARGWRGFHHHATLCIAAYGFLVSERGAIPPLRTAQQPAHQRTWCCLENGGNGQFGSSLAS